MTVPRALFHLEIRGERRWVVGPLAGPGDLAPPGGEPTAGDPVARDSVAGGPVAGVRAGPWLGLGTTLAELLAMPLGRARAVVDAAGDRPDGVAGGFVPLPPVDRQEVWAAGVTYQRSREGRREESGYAGIYDQVYSGQRPEIFFKASPWRVVGDGGEVGIRADSTWDAPEAEVGLIINSAGEVFGYALGNDMSSRSIEGDNPLYLPQAKIYDRSCALGPAIVPVWEAGSGPFDVDLRVYRDGREAFAGATSTAAMARRFDDLVDWLYRALPFPAGAVLLTGTGIVPGGDFTLRPGDRVTVSAPGLGTLTNHVVAVGRDGRPGQDREPGRRGSPAVTEEDPQR